MFLHLLTFLLGVSQFIIICYTIGLLFYYCLYLHIFLHTNTTSRAFPFLILFKTFQYFLTFFYLIPSYTLFYFLMLFYAFSYFLRIHYTVKPELTTTSEYRLPAHNDHYFEVHFSTFITQEYLWTTTTFQQRPLFLGPDGGRYAQVWLYRN